jgi:hypothetical protein
MSNIAMFNPSNVPAFAKNAALSATTLALAGGAPTSNGMKRVSIKGGVFRLLAGGKEIAAIDERFLDVIVVKAAPKVSRIFYAGSYDKDAAAAPPDCTSGDGDKPDAGVRNPQASTCAACPQNIAGSGNGNSRACRYQQRLAVVLANNPEGDVLQVTLPATSIFGKEEGDKRPLQAYARAMAAQTPPVNLDSIVTRMKFDTKAESPKLIFAPVRWLTDDEYEIVQTQSTSKDAEKAVSSTPAAVDGVTAPAPLAIEGKRPTKPMGELLAEEEPPIVAEMEAMAEARFGKPKKAKPAPVEAEEEPEVRKAPAKVEAAPAKKNKLADIVADWDDE